MPSVQQLCTSGMLLSHGSVAMRGTIEETITGYMNSIDQVSRQELRSRKDRQGDGRLRVVDVTFHDEAGERMEAAVCGQPLRVRIHYESDFGGTEHSVDVAFNLRNNSGVLLTCFANIQTGAAKLPLFANGYLECFWPKVNVRSGNYMSTLFVGVDEATADWLQNAFQVSVEDGNFFGTGNLVSRDHGDIVMEQSWTSERA
jgi:lipopolysaccharide transport system ATP-binding protein